MQDFFDEGNPFYIYLTDGKVLEYEVVSALVRTKKDRRKNANLLEKQGIQAYFDYSTDGDETEGIVKPGAALQAGKDKITQLETCELSSDGESRFVLTGRLTGESSWR